LTLQNVLLAVAAAIASGILTLYWMSDRLPALDAPRLAAARARWSAAGVSSYRLGLEMEGTELTKGRYAIEVRAGQVTSATRDGQPITGEAKLYAVDGLFTLLADELELARDPARSGQAPAGYRIYLLARFDRERGLPLQFRRVVGGNNRWVEWRVTGFEPDPVN
jgi:hypothetical protein